MYVADRLVLAVLTREEVAAIVAGEHSMDAHVRCFIHAHLSYRFAECADGEEARRVEAKIRRGALRAGRPLLNPVAR